MATVVPLLNVKETGVSLPVGKELLFQVSNELSLQYLTENILGSLYKCQRLADRVEHVDNEGSLGQVAKRAVVCDMFNDRRERVRNLVQTNYRELHELWVDEYIARMG